MSDLAEAYVHCGALARQHMRDHWIAALFAPEIRRKHLHALAAFAYETGRIKALVKEPLAGEMRLTWWIEAVEGLREAEAASHPVGAALLATIGEANLPRSRFEAWLLARRDELYHDSPSTEAVVRAEAPLFALSALALGAAADTAALAAGEARAAMAQSRPADALASVEAAGAALKIADRVVLPAFAPLAALKLDAQRAQKGKPRAPDWRRQIAIWRWRPAS